MSGRVGEDHREEERGLNYITALQTMLLRLERVELNAHGRLYKSTSHETPSAPLLGWSFKPTLMQFFLLLEWCDTLSDFLFFSGAPFILLASVWRVYVVNKSLISDTLLLFWSGTFKEPLPLQKWRHREDLQVEGGGGWNAQGCRGS